jgi:hypothetical protein
VRPLLAIALLASLAIPTEGLAGGWPEWPRLVELEVTSCAAGDVAGVRRMSPSLRERPEGEVLVMLREQPGLVIEGTLLRSRPIRFEDRVARSLEGWRDEEPQAQSLFLRVPAATCQAFPAGTRHVFTIHGPPSRGVFTSCDTVPAQELACALEPGSIATELRATAIRLAPAEHLLALKGLPGPILLGCASDRPADTPVRVRPLLGSRTRVIPIRRATVEPARADRFDGTASVRIALTIDRVSGAACGAPALLCSRGACFDETSRTRDTVGLEDVEFVVRRGDARELVSALEALR